MADVVDHFSGHGGQAAAIHRYYDNADGTYSEAVASHLYVKSGGVWIEWDGGGAGGPSSNVDVIDRSGRLVGIVSGGSNVFHVDDNAGSLTVDAPVGTPVWVRLSDGAAALVGQKAMAASVPVTIASDQTAVPVSGTVSLSANTPDVTDRAGRLLGHVTVDSAPTTAVTMASQTPDVTDRSARLLGHVTVDSAPTTAVTMAVQTPDVTDRAGRLLGHVTVDSAPTTAVTVSGTITDQNVAQTVRNNSNVLPVFDNDNRMLLELILMELKAQVTLLASLVPANTMQRPDLTLISGG